MQTSSLAYAVFENAFDGTDDATHHMPIDADLRHFERHRAGPIPVIGTKLIQQLTIGGSRCRHVDAEVLSREL